MTLSICLIRGKQRRKGPAFSADRCRREERSLPSPFREKKRIVDQKRGKREKKRTSTQLYILHVQEKKKPLLNIVKKRRTGAFISDE